MRTIAGLVLGLLVAGTAADGQDKKDPPKLEGTYIIVGLEAGGEKLPAELFEKAPEADRTIVIKGDKLIATKGGKEDAIEFKTDTSKTPAHITTTEKKPDGKTETSYGIFKVDGDTLIICMVESGKEADRPKEFKTTKDNKAMLMTLKKKKDK
jgi:uncharacterized protein (TIGR03067 family)